jgi:hypothetical protein
MKKVITIIALCALASITHAQLFVGGMAQIASTGGKTKTEPTSGSSVTVDNNSSFSMSLCPKVGFMMSEKIAVGSNLWLISNTNENPNTNTTNTTGTIGLLPFARYYVLNGEKFKMFAEAELGLTYSADKTTSNGVTTDGDKRIGRVLNVSPNVGYALSPKIELEARLNFVNCMFASNITKTELPNGDLQKITNNTANLKVDFSTIFTTGFLTIGAIYKL